MKKKFAWLLFFGLAFLAGCRPAGQTEDSAEQPAGPDSSTAVRVSAAETDAAEPAIAAGPDSNIYVVYIEHGPDKRSGDVVVQKFDQRGSRIGEKVRVNPEAGQARAWFGDSPTIRIGADKTVFILWTAKVSGAEKSSATDLLLSVSRDGGGTFDLPAKINDDAAPASHGMHSLEIDKSGRVYAAWLDERNTGRRNQTEKAAVEKPARSAFQFTRIIQDSHQKAPGEKSSGPHKDESSTANGEKEAGHEMKEPNSELFFAVSSDGGKTFSANKKISGEVCPCCKTSLAVAPDGRLYLSWRQVLPGEFRHIAVAFSIDGGKNFSPYRIVSDDQWQINACPVSGAPMYISPDGAVNIIWFTGGSAGKTGLQYARSADGGNTFSSRTLLFDGMVRGTAALSFAGPFGRSVLESGGKLFRVRFGSASEPASEEIGIGELPASAASDGNFFTCFIKSAGGSRSVWLLKDPGQ